ncbi:MAG: hypothetical protein H6978_11360 [Gammaproteobacteria bacterium]|nr:hypothetical protein [Gammaproteobacteria bacterium]
MSNILLGVLASILYLAATGRVLLGHQLRPVANRRIRLQAAALAALAVLLHALVLHDTIFGAADSIWALPMPHRW